MKWLSEQSDGVAIAVRVVPRASRTGVAAVEEEWLRVRLQAPPVDGQANKVLVRWLAKELKISSGDITLLRGATTRLKLLHLPGVSSDRVKRLLGDR